MTPREDREIATIRTELRRRLVAEDLGTIEPLLNRLRELARSADRIDHEEADDLRGEYERWRLRFEIFERLRVLCDLPAGAAAAAA